MSSKRPSDNPATSPDERPQKRARTSAPSQIETLRIVSWNIENPAPYLHAARSTEVSTSNRSISHYFSPSPSTSSKSTSRQKPKKQENVLAPSLRGILKEHDWPDLFCLQEVRTLAKDKAGIRALKSAGNAEPASVVRQGKKANLEDSGDTSSSSASDSDTSIPSAHVKTESVAGDGGPSYTAHLSLCQAKTGSGRFGVAVYISSRISGCTQYTAREVDWDAEGRIVIVHFPSLRLAVISVYALNGSEYPWRDPITGREEGTRSERKRNFNRLLAEEVKRMQAQYPNPTTRKPDVEGGDDEKKSLDVVMVGDWNVSREARDCFPRLRTEEPHAYARKLFNEEFMPSLRVMDAFRELHGDKRSYSVSAILHFQGE